MDSRAYPGGGHVDDLRGRLFASGELIGQASSKNARQGVDPGGAMGSRGQVTSTGHVFGAA